MQRLLFLLLLSSPACVIDLGGKDDTLQDDTGDASNSGGGNNSTWRPAGSGAAYLLDGELDHSRFTLELTRCTEPAEGEAYYGWLLGGGAPIALGEIPVESDQVIFDVELGLNAFEAGYNRFEAYAADAPPSAPGEGTPLWEGELPPDVVEVLGALLFASTATPNGEGSLRSGETTVETVRDFGLDNLDAIEDIAVLRGRGEAIRNAIKREAVDHDGSGAITLIPDISMGLIGEVSHTELIFDDLEAAFNAFGGNGAPEVVRAALDDAYDCVQNIERNAERAYSSAGIVTVCGAASSCRDGLRQAADRLQQVLDGEDLDGDGVIEGEEGTVECAIENISRMMAFDVSVP